MRLDGQALDESEVLPAGPPTDGSTLWLDVVGLADADVIRTVGERFDLHALALEDVVHVHQRPKIEEYADHLFIVARMPLLDDDGITTEQVSFFVGERFVITFQERPGDCFAPVRARMRERRARVLEGGATYVAYALLDALIDGFFPLLERLGDRLEDYDDMVFSDPSHETLEAVHDVKRALVTLRRAAWPLRDMLSSLLRGDHPLIREDLTPYLRDCHDHAIQIAELVEAHREHAGSLVDVYLSSLGHRQNEAMKVLTMIASVFIPLSFVAGLYGMNFDTASPYNMPELTWRYGYPAVLFVMAVLVAAMVLYFRRRKWL